MDARFKHGDPLTAPYTPSGAAVNAGDVKVVGDYPYVSHSNIAIGQPGALAVGGGVYEMTADGAIAAGTKVYWDGTAHKVTTTATAHKGFGPLEPGSSSAADGDKVRVIHRPF